MNVNTMMSNILDVNIDAMESAKEDNIIERKRAVPTIASGLIFIPR